MTTVSNQRAENLTTIDNSVLLEVRPLILPSTKCFSTAKSPWMDGCAFWQFSEDQFTQQTHKAFQYSTVAVCSPSQLSIAAVFPTSKESQTHFPCNCSQGPSNVPFYANEGFQSFLQSGRTSIHSFPPPPSTPTTSSAIIPRILQGKNGKRTKILEIEQARRTFLRSVTFVQPHINLRVLTTIWNKIESFNLPRETKLSELMIGKKWTKLKNWDKIENWNKIENWG